MGSAVNTPARLDLQKAGKYGFAPDGEVKACPQIGNTGQICYDLEGC